MSHGPIARVFLKDLRRFGPLILAAIGLTALSTGLAFYPASVFFADRNLGNILVILRWLLVVFIAIAAAQDDPVDGDRGGWLVRPISGLQVLSAKIAFLVATLALPAAIAAAWAAIAFQEGWHSVIKAAFWMGDLTLLVSLGATLLGALTGSLLRAVVVGAGLVLAYSFTKVHLDALSSFLFPHPGFGQKEFWIPWDRLLFGQALGGTIGGVAVLWHQYGRRRAGRSVILGAGVLTGTWLLGYGWPALTIYNAFHHESLQSAAPPVSLRVTDARAYVEQVQTMSFPQPDRVVLGLQMTRGAEAGGEEVYLDGGQSRLTFGHGRSFAMSQFEGFQEWGSSSEQTYTEEGLEAALSALGAPAVPRPSRNYAIGVLTIPRSSYESLRGVHGELESWVDFSAKKMEVTDRLPLRPGARTVSHGKLWRIRSVFLLPNGNVNISLDSVILQPEPPFDDYAEASFGLTNGARNEFAGDGNSWLLGDDARSTLVLRGSENQLTFHQTWNIATRQRTAGLDEEWLRHAELVVMIWHYHEVSVTHFNWGEIDLPTATTKR